MGMIRIYSGKSKPANKKPGWQKAEAEHEAWLKSLKSQTLFNPAAKPKMKYTNKKLDPVVSGVFVDEKRLIKNAKSVMTPGDTSTKAVIRPEIMYKGNEDMVERERIARQRKFNTAPAYNKGGDVFVTEEHLVTQLKGNKRR